MNKTEMTSKSPLGTPTRRDVMKAASAAGLTLSVAPAALANTGPQLMRHASRELILQFEVPPPSGS